MVYKQPYEGVDVYCVDVLASLCKVAKLHLVLHVVNLLLGGVVTHGTH